MIAHSVRSAGYGHGLATWLGISGACIASTRRTMPREVCSCGADLPIDCAVRLSGVPRFPDCIDGASSVDGYGPSALVEVSTSEADQLPPASVRPGRPSQATVLVELAADAELFRHAWARAVRAVIGGNSSGGLAAPVGRVSQVAPTALLRRHWRRSERAGHARCARGARRQGAVRRRRTTRSCSSCRTRGRGLPGPGR